MADLNFRTLAGMYDSRRNVQMWMESQSVAAADPDATNSSSSTSSTSLVNTSTGSFGASSCAGGLVAASESPMSPSALYEQQIREPFKLTNFTKHQQQQPNISNHLLELQREIKEEEEEIFADINSLINNRSNLYSSFEDDTDEFEDTIGGRSIGRSGCIGGGRQPTPTITNTSNSISCYPFSLTKHNNNDIARHRENLFHPEDEDQGLGNETNLIGDENTLGRQHQGRFFGIRNDVHKSEDDDKPYEVGSSNNNQYYSEQKYALCNRFTGQHKQQQQAKEQGERSEGAKQQRQENNLDEQQSERELQEQQQQQQQYLELDGERFHDHEQLETDNYQAIQRDFQNLTSNLPKPCVFFLEGNCRRSDCKYSHDLSSITCKYWIEGFCFKGEMCPFLHSFAPKGQDSSMLDDELAMAKRELNPTFVIESEADFPSLPLDAPEIMLGSDSRKDLDSSSLTKTIKNQILSSNPAVVFKTTKKKRKKG